MGKVKLKKQNKKSIINIADVENSKESYARSLSLGLAKGHAHRALSGNQAHYSVVIDLQDQLANLYTMCPDEMHSMRDVPKVLKAYRKMKSLWPICYYSQFQAVLKSRYTREEIMKYMIGLEKH